MQFQDPVCSSNPIFRPSFILGPSAQISLKSEVTFAAREVIQSSLWGTALLEIAQPNPIRRFN